MPSCTYEKWNARFPAGHTKCKMPTWTYEILNVTCLHEHMKFELQDTLLVTWNAYEMWNAKWLLDTWYVNCKLTSLTYETRNWRPSSYGILWDSLPRVHHYVHMLIEGRTTETTDELVLLLSSSTENEIVTISAWLVTVTQYCDGKCMVMRSRSLLPPPSLKQVGHCLGLKVERVCGISPLDSAQLTSLFISWTEVHCGLVSDTKFCLFRVIVCVVNLAFASNILRSSVSTSRLHSRTCYLSGWRLGEPETSCGYRRHASRRRAPLPSASRWVFYTISAWALALSRGLFSY